jgi:hypothetical protein
MYAKEKTKFLRFRTYDIEQNLRFRFLSSNSRSSVLKANATTTGEEVNNTFFCGAYVKILDPLADQPKVKKQKQLKTYESLELTSTAAAAASRPSS